jgi:UDP-glucuronate 4-epimerase
LGVNAHVDYRPEFGGDMPVTCADLRKAQRLLGYRPRVEIAEGVRDFVAWFRSWREQGHQPSPGRAEG